MEAHEAFRWTDIRVSNGRGRFMQIGEALVASDDVTDAHKQALADPRPADS